MPYQYHRRPHHSCFPVTAQDVLTEMCLVAEYDRKKYVWKLLYIYMLGYEVEFGHKQAADLIPAQK